MKLIEEFKVKWWLHIICFIFSLDIMYFTYDYLNEIIDTFMIHTYKIMITQNFVINQLILYFVILFIIVIIHEVIHGLAYKSLGGKFKIKFSKGFPCCVETSGIIITSFDFIYVLLLPTIFFTLVWLIFGGWLFGLIMILNLLGATGDLFMAFICLFRLKSNIKDSPSGFIIINKL